MLLFQAEIRPDMHGCNELRFNLTADSIQAIFKTYPAGMTIFLSNCLFLALSFVILVVDLIDQKTIEKTRCW